MNSLFAYCSLSKNRIKYSSNTHLWWSAPGSITQGKLKVKQRSRVYYKIALGFYSKSMLFNSTCLLYRNSKSKSEWNTF